MKSVALIRMSLLLAALLFATGAPADDYAEAKGTVNKIMNQILILVQKPEYKEDESKLIGGLEEKMLIFVDMKTMSKLALGRHWASSTSQQRQDFVSGFKRMLLGTYAKSVLLLHDMEYEVLPPATDAPKRKYQIVKTKLTFDAGKTTLLVDYSLVNRDGAWKVFDLWVDGVSLLSQFRQNFDAEIKETSFSQLIRRLQSL